MMKGIKCKSCKNLVNDWCDVQFDSPDPALVRDCIGFEQFANGDRIRAMSDEALAIFFDCVDPCAICRETDRIESNPFHRNEKCDGDCVTHVLEWLKQPCEVRT